jgi:hypothetical protein
MAAGEEEPNAYAPPVDEPTEAPPPRPTRTPWPLTATVIVSGLVLGPCGMVSNAFAGITKGLRPGGDPAAALSAHALGGCLGIATLYCLWGIWERKKRFVWAFLALTLLQLVTFGIANGATLFAVAFLLGTRAPPVVAAYFYSRQFR